MIRPASKTRLSIGSRLRDEPDEAAAPIGAPRRAAKRHPVLRAIMFGSGIVLILMGFALGFVPFLPGFPLGLAGIALLAASSTRVRALLRRGMQRLPQTWRTRLRSLMKRHRGSSQR